VDGLGSAGVVWDKTTTVSKISKETVMCYLSSENPSLNTTPKYLQFSSVAKILKYSALESWL